MNVSDDSKIGKRRSDSDPIFSLAPEFQRLLVVGHRPLIVAFGVSEDAGSTRSLGLEGRRQTYCHGQRSLQPPPACRQVTAHPPEAPARGGNSWPCLDLTSLLPTPER